ncbi:3-hydroxybutyryl-CoA dehydrogenase [Malassezia vespertilionis]|uniref:3-hydroxybutyryl-CoA dehydrogenase n=1 Tax=Malassezia vespertilionis TaxID=2020962 RepID=UPI0024B2270B|nr:3-hydroxybutyryl-CoA dehydrogenase [Malassezia vespertilionis]WFD05479.1 3-hydroxybutyryl-CoA dehydrogenase [Malassezia vespertilionis]
MGEGIAFVSAVFVRAPQVLVYDVNATQVDKAIRSIKLQVEKMYKRRMIDKSTADAACNSVKPVYSLEELAKGDAPDFVIEAATENLELKLQLFTELAKLLPLNTVLASNTSSLSLTDLASAAARGARPEDAASSAARVVGIHFFNPVAVMRLIEVVPALQTSKEVIECAFVYAKACKKTPVLCVDTPGFIVNRINIVSLREAILMYESKAASLDDIDRSMQYGMGHRLGPLRLADFIGLDTAKSNGNKYWENLDEQPGRTRWVDFREHDFDSSQLDPIWHAWVSYIRAVPPSVDQSLGHFVHDWQLYDWMPQIATREG